MRGRELRTLVLATLAALAFGAPSTLAAQCGDSSEGFKAWLEDFKQVAINDGVSPEVVDNALAAASFDPSVLAHDHGQGLHENFASFAARQATPGRLKRGRTMLIAYAEPFAKIEQRYGVPAPALVAICGLATAFGAGHCPLLTCRRPA